MLQLCVARPDNPISFLREYFQKLERETSGSKAAPLSPDDAEEVESPMPQHTQQVNNQSHQQPIIPNTYHSNNQSHQKPIFSNKKHVNRHWHFFDKKWYIFWAILSLSSGISVMNFKLFSAKKW
jgi:hypothetical protein